MRFPFFATNKMLDRFSVNGTIFRGRMREDIIDLKEQASDMRQKILVLEGEINKLKGDEKRGRQKKGN